MRRFIYYGSESGSYNPLTDTPGLELYLNKRNSTPEIWLDQSPNAYSFIQNTGSQKPVIGPNSVIYDGVNDIQVKTINNAFGSDNTGYMFFSGYYNSSSQNRIINSANDTVGGHYFSFEVRTGGKLAINSQIGGSNIVTSTNSITNGDYYYGYISTNGSSWTISLNGVIETITIVAGSNIGQWFNDSTAFNKLSIGSLSRLPVTFGDAGINKIIYSNATLTAGEISDIDTFMSDENN